MTGIVVSIIITILNSNKVVTTLTLQIIIIPLGCTKFFVIKMMREVTGSKPAMWGESLIGFGDVHLKYASGRELDWFKIGFSPRKNDLSLYVLCESPLVDPLLEQLGPHKRGKGCLYIRSLDIINLTVLEKIIKLASKFKKGGCV